MRNRLFYTSNSVAGHQSQPIDTILLGGGLFLSLLELEDLCKGGEYMKGQVKLPSEDDKKASREGLFFVCMHPRDHMRVSISKVCARAREHAREGQLSYLLDDLLLLDQESPDDPATGTTEW